MSALGAIGTHMVMPALPALVREFGTTPDRVQMTISIFLIALAISQIAVGPLADRFGRRAVLLAGLAVFILASAGCAMASSIEWLIATRVLQGASSCTGLVIARLLLRDLFTRSAATSKLGFITTCVSVAPTFGPVAGGLLFERFGWTGIFWFLAMMGAIILAGALIFVQEPPRPAAAAPSPPMVSAFGALLRNAEFLCFFAMIGIVTGAFYVFASGAPYLGERFLHLTPAEYGLWFAPVAFGHTLGAFLAGNLAVRVGPLRLLFVGAGILLTFTALGATLLLCGYQSPLTLFGPMSLANIGTGLIMPSAIIAAVNAVTGIAGMSAGMVGLSQFGSAAIFSFLAGAIVQRSGSALPLIALIFGLSILMASLAVWIARRRIAQD